MKILYVGEPVASKFQALSFSNISLDFFIDQNRFLQDLLYTIVAVLKDICY